MSFNLGNWWKDLKCEVCSVSALPPPVPDEPIDLFPDDYGSDWEDPDPYGLSDPSPEPDNDDGFDFPGIPGVPLPGGGEATPDWDDGPGVDFTWPWP